MARRCELTGVAPMTGNNVSHSHRKTRRRFLPNLQEVTLLSDALGRSFRFRITTAALRSVDHVGGLDKFLVKADDETLSANARKVKRDLKKKLAAPQPA
jgi:large subunit ribosomal protein L28